MNQPLDDKSRLVKILKLLPEKFVDDLVRDHLYNACYPREMNGVISEYGEYKQTILSEFSNPKINKNWKAFNKSFYTLRKFLVDNFWCPKHSLRDYLYLRPDIHHNFMERIEREENETDKDWHERCDKASVEWDKYKYKLDELAGEFEKAYKDFIKIAKVELGVQDKRQREKKWYEKWWGQLLIGIAVLIIGSILLKLVK